MINTWIQEVTGAIACLLSDLSDNASHITGTTLHVDDGCVGMEGSKPGG